MTLLSIQIFTQEENTSTSEKLFASATRRPQILVQKGCAFEEKAEKKYASKIYQRAKELVEHLLEKEFHASSTKIYQGKLPKENIFFYAKKDFHPIYVIVSDKPIALKDLNMIFANLKHAFIARDINASLKQLREDPFTSISKVAQVQKLAGEVSEIAHDSMNKILERSENLEILQKKTQQIAEGSFSFKIKTQKPSVLGFFSRVFSDLKSPASENYDPLIPRRNIGF